MHTRPRARLLTAIVALCGATAAPGEPVPEVVVVVGAHAPALAPDARTLRDVFLERITVDDAGARIVPLNLPPASPTRAAFTAALWGQRPLDQQKYWNERYFHGVRPPYVVASAEAMLRYVSETPGAVGYVAACRADARVRVLLRLPAPPALAAALQADCAD